MTTSTNLDFLDFGSSDFKIPGLESKFDFIGVPNSFVRCFEAELNRFESTVLYQLLRWHSWSNSGVVLRGIKWIYKSVPEMIQDAFRGIKPGKLYRGLQKLAELGFLLREQLHREHKGDCHAYDAYNRRYYYSPVMDRVMESITNTLAEQSPRNKETEAPDFQKDGDVSPQIPETLGFTIMENQVSHNETTDFPKQKNNTHTTSTSTHSLTPPLTPLGESGSTQEKIISKNSQDIPREQEQGNSNLSSQKVVNSKPTPFADVVARPPGVEQKVNKPKLVQEVVQDLPVQENVQKQPPEAAQAEVMPPKQVKRSSKRKKTPKGTKPVRDFGLAPWTSLEQFQRFYRRLIDKLSIVANSRSPEGLAHQITNQLKQGVPHSYWDDFINGLPIGTSTQQEWEVEPGVAHPMFVEYLAEKLIKGNNTQTREQAIAHALNILRNPQQAIFFWKECKISLGNALHEAERHRANGVKALSTPLWTKERPELTLEEAATAGIKIQQINSSSENAIEAAQNHQIEGSTQQIEPSAHNTSNTPQELDPWLDEEKPKKPKISDFASDKFKALLSKGSANKSQSQSVKPDCKPDEWRRQPLKIEKMNLAEINKALLDPILRGELTPQLMLSDYEFITDETGRILRIEETPF